MSDEVALLERINDKNRRREGAGRVEEERQNNTYKNSTTDPRRKSRSNRNAMRLDAEFVMAHLTGITWVTTRVASNIITAIFRITTRCAKPANVAVVIVAVLRV